MSKLSVLITAFNQHPVTVLHVKESMNSTRVPDEIVVVNDNGTPDLLDMLKEIPRKCPIHYARINEDILWNYTGARNLAFWISRSWLPMPSPLTKLTMDCLLTADLRPLSAHPHRCEAVFPPRL